MITVYKYIIDPNSPSIMINDKAEILSITFQGNELCLWAKVDTNNKLVSRNFNIYGTGHEIRNESLAFIGTAFLGSMSLVFHVFEKIK